jgi:mannosylfructose-phosphate synthase
MHLTGMSVSPFSLPKCQPLRLAGTQAGGDKERMVKSIRPTISGTPSPAIRQIISTAVSARVPASRLATEPLPCVAMISLHGYVASRPPLGATDTGGQVVFVLEQARKLALMGYQVDVWTRMFDGQPSLESLDARVRILRMPCGGAGFLPKEHLCDHVAEWCAHALTYIEEHGLEYTFINSHYWDAGLAGARLGTALNIPHLHTPHSLGWWKRKLMKVDGPSSGQELELRYNFTTRIAAEREIYRDCDAVVATTPAQRDLLVREYDVPPEKVHMIPAGYDDHRFFAVGASARAAIRERLGFRGKVILALGRLAQNKGFDLLIEAFPTVARREPEAVLHLAVGGRVMTGNEQALLARLKQQAMQTGFGERIQFGSFVEENDLPDFYRAADLFVLSSRYEPFGMTAIEAMASGTPTVVTIHGGLHRALSFGRHAVSADPFDSTDLGMTMVNALRDLRMRERLSRMGAHLARSLFTWSGITHQLLALVEAPRPSRPEERLAPLALAG